MRGYKEARGQTPDGRKRWRLRINLGAGPDGNRETYSETFIGSARDADRRKAALITELDGLAELGRRRTFGQLVDEWRQLSAPKLARSTRRAYERNLRLHVLPYFAETPVRKITVYALERRYRALAEAGRKPAMVHQVHAVISAILSAGVRWGWLEVNVARATERDPIRWAPPRITERTEAELVKVFAAITDTAFRTACVLASSSGVRRGELVALRWSDFDLEAGAVRIERALAAEPGLVYAKDTKTHQARTVTLDAGTLALLLALWSEAAAYALECGAELGADGYLFAKDPEGRVPWSPNVITTRWTAACARAGVHGVRFHDLRHYHATAVLELGGDITAARDRLGHRDLSTTNRYAHARVAADRRAADAVGARLVEIGLLAADGDAARDA